MKHSFQPSPAIGAVALQVTPYHSAPHRTTQHTKHRIARHTAPHRTTQRTKHRIAWHTAPHRTTQQHVATLDTFHCCLLRPTDPTGLSPTT